MGAAATEAISREPVVNPNGQRLMRLQQDLRRREAALAELDASPGPRPFARRLAVQKVAAQRRKVAVFLASHPDARAFADEVAIREEAHRQGILARVQAVAAAFKGAGFAADLNAAIKEAKGTSRDPINEVEVRDLVIDLLHGLGVDPADVLITLFWAPPKLRLSVRGMTPQARLRCLGAVEARRAGKEAA